MDQETDEYELAMRACGGDREALAALVEQTRPWLFTLAYAELRHYDDAQDAVASTLLQVCRNQQAAQAIPASAPAAISPLGR